MYVYYFIHILSPILPLQSLHTPSPGFTWAVIEQSLDPHHHPLYSHTPHSTRSDLVAAKWTHHQHSMQPTTVNPGFSTPSHELLARQLYPQFQYITTVITNISLHSPFIAPLCNKHQLFALTLCVRSAYVTYIIYLKDLHINIVNSCIYNVLLILTIYWMRQTAIDTRTLPKHKWLKIFKSKIHFFSVD